MDDAVGCPIQAFLMNSDRIFGETAFEKSFIIDHRKNCHDKIGQHHEISECFLPSLEAGIIFSIFEIADQAEHENGAGDLHDL